MALGTCDITCALGSSRQDQAIQLSMMSSMEPCRIGWLNYLFCLHNREEWATYWAVCGFNSIQIYTFPARIHGPLILSSRSQMHFCWLCSEQRGCCSNHNSYHSGCYRHRRRYSDAAHATIIATNRGASVTWAIRGADIVFVACAAPINSTDCDCAVPSTNATTASKNLARLR